MKKIFQKHETYIALIIIVLSIIVGSFNKEFFSLENLFDILKSNVVIGIFSLGVLLVLVSGDIDVSFTAIAALSMYLTVKILLFYKFEGSFIVAFIISGFFGIMMGLLNAIFIGRFKLKALIVTIGTMSIFRGFMLTFVGTEVFRVVPSGMIRLSKISIVEYLKESGRVISLSALIIFLILFSIVVWLLLKYTMLGRGIYAIGGDRMVAERTGFNIVKIQFFIYGFVGFLSGIAGIVHSTITRIGNPFDIVGTELNVIAAVVLGGASLFGGRGNVLGTLLGVFLIVLISNSLIMLGVTSLWTKVVIGLVIIISVGITANRERRELKASLA